MWRLISTGGGSRKYWLLNHGFESLATFVRIGVTSKRQRSGPERSGAKCSFSKRLSSSLRKGV